MQWRVYIYAVVGIYLCSVAYREDTGMSDTAKYAVS
jgi:hypothetical protein